MSSLAHSRPPNVVEPPVAAEPVCDESAQPEAGRPVARPLPAAVYRLQLHAKFGFREARRLVPYLAALGISECYASPFIKARTGSLHGYDIVDHNQINPEIGTREEGDEFSRDLEFHGMSLVLDVVPNHMGVATDENAWWFDVLENGRSSPYASYFDIDWSPLKHDLANKVLLPVLGDQFGKVLESGQLVLCFEEGTLFLRCYGRRLPIAPHSWPKVLKHNLAELEARLGADNPQFQEYQSILFSLGHLPPLTEAGPESADERRREKEVVCRRLSELCQQSPAVRDFIDANVRLFNGKSGEPASFDLLDDLLLEQPYRLAHWQVASDEINYRRFFDVNDLAALCMEREDVFRATHELIGRLIAEGRVAGLRIDHPDGLYDPAEYLHRLQGLSAEYVVVEKILEPGERLPEDWPVHGTTGYEFLNTLNGLYVDRGRVKEFDRVYARFIREAIDWKELVYRSKKLIMQVSMSSEISVLGHQLDRISERDRLYRDFTLNSLTVAIREIIACFPVYRTYVTAAGTPERDRHYIELATGRARRRNPAISESIFHFVRDILLLKPVEHLDEAGRAALLRFVGKFQQTTGPVMAKAVEDTAFYIFNRLLSLNEVGGDPERFGTTVSAFHQQNIDRQAHWPHALLASSTHDTKRSEDVRARINVLSELPAEWKTHLARWARCNKRHKREIDGEPAPSRNDEYMYYQTLIGTWPAEAFSAGGREEFIARMQQYALKAAHEAKQHTSWISPHEPYEQAIREFIAATLAPGARNLFLADFEPFARHIADLGIWNSLSQTLLKLTSPGVPDLYQGTELFDFHLVDPDNRGPVNFARRDELLQALERRVDESSGRLGELAAEFLALRADGRIKLYVIRQLLNFRREHPDLFTTGQYLPLDLEGNRRESVCAFLRRQSDVSLVVAAPRLVAGLAGESGAPPVGSAIWDDTRLVLPKGLAGGRFVDLFTGRILTPVGDGDSQSLPLASVFESFPIAALEYVAVEPTLA
ncbi:MAG: malto-oligosyltrehalose synthase [Planctomycetia bacterium]|nr:malto-oligosyltrehalose synthase [Planctomycetia bacterium]